MIIVTGDTHRDFSRLGNRGIGRMLGKGDFVIVAGDFGLCWAYDREFEYWKEWLSDKEFTTLFIDGNHENFDMLESYPVENWNGGKVHHIVQDKVIHLMRGQIFNIDKKSIFTFGGGQSHDIQGGVLDKNDKDFREKVKRANRNYLPYRVIGESWWSQELPSEEEMSEGLQNLEAHDWQVDYIITHSICDSKLADIGVVTGIKKMLPDKLTTYLEEVKEKTSYKKWYCGHYHTNSLLDTKHEVLYKSFKELI